MNPRFWSGMRVFLTGHTGFKGSWLSLWLQDAGAEVTGYALEPPTTPSLYEAASVASGMHSITADIRDGERLTRSMKEAQPAIVFHMAAQSLVRPSYSNPVETYATNAMGTVNLLEAVRSTDSVRAVVIVTSDKCYENREWLWGYRESEALGGYDPYSSSKACAEIATAAYRTSYFHPREYEKHRTGIASARAGNVVGGGDWAQDRLIPDIARALSSGQPVRIRNASSIRPWQHVLSPLHGYLALAERLFEGDPGFADAWNFGPDDTDARSVEWIVNRMCRAWSEGATWINDGPNGPHEAKYLKLDSSKARAMLGWHPAWNLDQALDRIVAWYKAFSRGQDMRRLTTAQIHEYLVIKTG